jgi:hypothetical protein
MKKTLLFTLVTAALAVASSFAAQGVSSPYTDAVNDIDASFNTAGNGTLNILGMEVANNATDITFTLTVNGNVSTTDWGKFMIGFATGGTGTTTGNGWNRPINLSSPIGGMDYWIGSWVDDGGGAELYSYGSVWSLSGATYSTNFPGSFSFVGGPTSTVTYTATLASLGLAVDDVFYFDAYSSGGGGADSAIDALANPNVSVTTWAGPYTSSTTGDLGPGLNSYQVVPEPSTYALLALSALSLAGYAARRRAARK